MIAGWLHILGLTHQQGDTLDDNLHDGFEYSVWEVVAIFTHLLTGDFAPGQEGSTWGTGTCLHVQVSHIFLVLGGFREQCSKDFNICMWSTHMVDKVDQIYETPAFPYTSTSLLRMEFYREKNVSVLKCQTINNTFISYFNKYFCMFSEKLFVNEVSWGH